MRDEDAFLLAIVSNPDDDAPRLIYADWLEEQGETDRAALIRSQIDRESLPGGDPRGDTLLLQIHKLLSDHGSALAAPFAHFGLLENYRRGFPEELTSDARVFLKHSDELFRKLPIRRLTLYGLTEPLCSEVLASSSLTHLQALLLPYNPIGDGGCEQIARCPFLAHLIELDLTRTSLRDRGARSLAYSPYLSSLEVLTVGENPRLTERGQSQLRHRFGRRVRF